jgi:hypothetical protein
LEGILIFHKFLTGFKVFGVFSNFNKECFRKAL